MWLASTNATQWPSKARDRRQHWPDRAAAYANFTNVEMFKRLASEALQTYADYALKDAGGRER